MKPRSNDLNIRYEWQEGSLPPPYHYEYAITIKSIGDSEITMIPDYAMHDAPTWIEKFQLSPAALGALNRTLIQAGLFTREWRAQEHPSVGGSHESLDATMNDKTIHIPSYVIRDQAPATNEIFSAIKACVPQAIWDKLYTQREQYVHEREK